MASPTSSLCSAEEGDGASRISGATLEKARRELREDPQTRVGCIRSLRKAIEGYERQPGEEEAAFHRTDDKFLLRFLRARKFDEDRALRLYVNYYLYRHKYREILDGVTPQSLDHIVQSGVFGVLPRPLKNGSRCLCLYSKRWEANAMPAHDCYRLFMLILEKLIDDEEAQVHGISMLDNAEGASMQLLYRFVRSDTWKLGVELQDAFPARFKGLHFIHQPWYVSLVTTVVKPFLKQKHKDRFHTHGDNVDSLFQYVEPETLPADFGGLHSPLNPEDLYAFLEPSAETIVS